MDIVGAPAMFSYSTIYNITLAINIAKLSPAGAVRPKENGKNRGSP